MGKSELEHLQIENGITSVSYYEGMDPNHIRKVIYNCKSFERPDIISLVDNVGYAIEHFEYDCYKHNRKGSAYQQEEACISRKLLNNLKDKDSDFYSRKVESIATLDHFITNFLEAYNKHYENISDYRQNVENKLRTSELKVWFVAEFTGGLPALFENNDGIKILHPLRFKEIAEKIIKDIELDGIAFVDQEQVLAIPRHKCMQSKFLKKEEVKLLTTNPLGISFVTKIPSV